MRLVHRSYSGFARWEGATGNSEHVSTIAFVESFYYIIPSTDAARGDIIGDEYMANPQQRKAGEP